MKPPALPPRHPTITSVDVLSSQHAHWGRFGSEGEGAYFRAIEEELSKESPGEQTIKDYLTHLQSFAYLRAQQMIHRFANAMKHTLPEEDILHADMIAAARQLWSLPSETPYIITVRQSLERLKPHRKVLDTVSISIDPRVSGNRQPTDAMLGNAFRSGRNHAVKLVNESEDSKRAVELMMDGRALPSAPQPSSAELLPTFPQLDTGSLGKLKELHGIVKKVPFDLDRAQQLVADLYTSAESMGRTWASSFVNAVGNDAPEVFQQRKKLLQQAKYVLHDRHGFFIWTHQAKVESVYSTYPPTSAAAHFLRIDDVSEPPKRNPQARKKRYTDLLELLSDAFDKGVKDRLKLAAKDEESPTAVAYSVDANLNVRASDATRIRLCGNGRERLRAVALDELGDFYGEIVNTLKGYVVPAIKQTKLKLVILANDVEDGIRIEFRSQDNWAVGAASAWVPGPRQTTNKKAAWTSASFESLYHRRIPVGDDGWFARDFSQADPLLEDAYPIGIDPVDYLVLRNTGLDPIRRDDKTSSKEIKSRILFKAWKCIANSGADLERMDIKVSRDRDGTEHLRCWDSYCHHRIKISANEDGEWEFHVGRERDCEGSADDSDRILNYVRFYVTHKQGYLC